MTALQELSRLARYESLVELSDELNRSSGVDATAEIFARKLKYIGDVLCWRYLDSGMVVDGERGQAAISRVDRDVEPAILDIPGSHVYEGDALATIRPTLPSAFQGLSVARVYVCPQFAHDRTQSVLIYGTAHDFNALDVKFLSLASHLFSGKMRQMQMEQELKNEMEERLRYTEKMRALECRMLVQERMASLGNLVAGVAHELNTPLGALTAGHDTVLKAAKKLKATVSEETAQGNGLDAVLDIISDSTKAITTATDRVETIVGSLMSFAGVDQATYQTVDVHVGIESALALLQSKIGSRIAVEREYGTIDPLYCASAQMNQVFMHVVRNAIEAIEGEGSIKITTEMMKSDIEIRITDTGSGMPPEVVRKIFDFVFRQESRVRMGFGLFLARKIVDDHGGRIEVESEPGRGTSVTIRLPLRSPADYAED